MLVCIRLLSNAIVKDDDSILLLDLPPIRLHDLPQLGRPESFFRQPPLDLVMAHAPAHQPGQARSCRLSEPTDQIIALEVQQFFVFHSTTLAHGA
jgi:hypothetical protein